MEEIWKDVKEYEGLYQVSNLGRIKSLKRIGKNKRFYGGKILKITFRPYGEVGLSKNCKTKTFLIHRVVANAFLENKENKPQINHINGIKTDNRVENLEYCTQQENNIHAIKNKLRITPSGCNHYLYGKYSEKHPNSKKIAQYTLDNDLIKVWNCAADVQRELNIPKSNLCKCCKGERKTAGSYKWKYV